MKPKDKALQLVNSYSHLVTTWDCRNDEPLDIKYRIGDMKKCAIISVDEIVFALQNQINQVDNIDIIYWKKVKQEIKKL